MISILIENELIDLFPNTKIPLVLVNPLFSREIGYGSHSFRFDVPDTPKNRRLLGFKNLISLDTSSRDIDANIRLGGLAWKQTTVKVVAARPYADKFSVAFNIDSSQVKSQAEKILLKDLDLGGLRNTAQSETPEAILTLDTLPINGRVILGVNGQDFEVIMSGTGSETANSVLSDIANQINLALNVIALVNVDQITITSQGGDFWVRNDVPGDDGLWTVTKNRSSFAIGASDLVNHMKIIQSLPFGPYAFPTVKNPSFYASPDITGFEGYINLYDTINDRYVTNSTSDPYRTTIVPFVSVSFLVTQACQALGLSNISAFTNSNDFRSIYLYSNISLDREADQGAFGSSATGKVNWFQPTFDLKDHVHPEMTVHDLFREISYYFNLAIFVDPVANTIDFIPRSNAFSSVIKDWREKTLADYAISYKDARPTKYSFKPDASDKLFSLGKKFNSINPGGHKQELIAISPLFELSESHPFGDSWKITWIDQAGGTTLGDVSPADFNPRFLFVHNFQLDSAGNNYPASSNKGRNHTGISLTTGTLLWENSDGLYEVNHKDFEPLLYPMKHSTNQFLLDFFDILSFQFDDQVRCRVLEGEQTFVIKSLSFDLQPDMHFPIIAKADLYLT